LPVPRIGAAPLTKDMRPIRRFFAVVAVILFAVAFLLTVSIVTGGNATAWQDAGLVALAAALAI
jgi:Na+/melibiose symporter-like transporter